MGVVFIGGGGGGGGEPNMLDEYTTVMAKILKGEWLAVAMDEEGLLWSSQVMSEIMPYDVYWALFASCGSQRRMMRTGHCLPPVAPRDA